MTATADVLATEVRVPVPEAERLFGRTRRVLMRAAKAGAIRAWRVGGRIELAKADVEKFATGSPIAGAAKS